MTTRAVIDTPWLTVIDGTEATNAPKLPYDPLFEAAIQGWRDVTGSEGQEVDAGGGVMKTLYGGNYAAVTSISPDHSVGRLGGSGDPDALVIEITFDEVANPTLLADIDALAEYNVYESYIVEEEATP